MAVEGKAVVMHYSEKELPEPVEIKFDIKDEFDNIRHEYCQEKIDLGAVKTENGTDTEIKREDDWEMLEAEICPEIPSFSIIKREELIKDEDDDITDNDIKLEVPDENRIIKAEPLEAESNTDDATENFISEDFDSHGIIPKKEEDGLMVSGFQDDVTGALPSFNIEAMVSADRKSLTYTATQKQEIAFNVFNDTCEEGLFKCLHPGCSFHTLNRRAFRGHCHNKTTLTHKTWLSHIPKVRKRLSTRHKLHCNKSLTEIYSCYHCSFSTNRRPVFILHVKRHPKLPIVKCKKCDYRSMKQVVARHYYKEHFDVKSHDGELYKCELCSFTQSLKYKKAIERHINKHDTTHGRLMKKAKHKKKERDRRKEKEYKEKEQSNHLKYTHSPFMEDDKKYHCKLCAFTTSSKIYFKRHEKFHLKNYPIEQCPHCELKFMRTTLKYHIRNVHNLPTEFFCKLCSYSTSILYSFKKHEHAHLKNYPIEQCAHCEFRSTSQALECHMKSVHNLRRGRTHYYCKLCSFRTSLLRCFKKHEQTHQKNDPIKQCPNCDFRSTKRTLGYHIKSVHNLGQSIVHNCKLCSYSTSRLSSFKTHEQTHLKNDPIKQCPNCEYRSTKKMLERHIKSAHNLEPNLCCKLCSYSTSRLRDLKRHEENHLKNFPIEPCPYCDFRSTKTYLDQHIKVVHNLKVEHYCDLCSFSTSSLNALKAHKRAHLNNDLVEQCPHCEFRSIKRALQCHMKSVHGARTKH